MKELAAAVLVALCSLAGASPDAVEDVRTGTDICFDLKYMTYSYSGAMSGAGEVTDKDAPPGCAPKKAGTLNFMLDTGALGLPFSTQIPVFGTKLSPTRVRWTFDSLINECVTIYIDGDPVNVLIRRVWGRLTAAAEETTAVWDDVCERTYNVFVEEWGGDAENFINAEAYAFCIQLLSFRIDFEGRDIDVEMLGGVGRLYANSVEPFRGILLGGSIDSLRYSDNDYYEVRPWFTLSTLESPVQVLLTGVSPVQEPDELRFIVESRANVPNVRQRIRLYDFAAGAYEDVDSRIAPTTDTVIEIHISAKASRFVGPGGTVTAQLLYKEAGPVLVYPWRAMIDQAIWIVP